MIESQKELPLRGALSSRHCEEQMSAKQSRIKISGGEENVAWPGIKCLTISLALEGRGLR